MIKRDPLTPCSAGDFVCRMHAAIDELDRADRALTNAWDERNHAKWPRNSTSLKDMVSDSDPGVIAAEAQIEAARAMWREAHAKLVVFFNAPVEFVCAVDDWRVSPWRSRERCTLPACHDGGHSFETIDLKPAERPVSSGGQS